MEEDNGIFDIAKDIKQSGVVRFTILEENWRSVGQVECYYMCVTEFEAKANKTYTVKFNNDKQKKIVQMFYQPTLSRSELEGLVMKEESEESLISVN